MSNQKQTPPIFNELDAKKIVDSLAQVVTATLDVGASLARATAEVTAGERPVPKTKEGTGPLEEMVHYSILTVTNVFGAVKSGVNEIGGRVRSVQPGSATPPRPPTSPQPRASFPVIHAGSTLRMPLSIENPGPEPMNDMAFHCMKMSGGQAGDGQPLAPDSVRFVPEILTVAPRDFEKLTVFIDVSQDTAVGEYQAIIGLENGLFESTLMFEVIPPEESE